MLPLTKLSTYISHLEDRVKELETLLVDKNATLERLKNGNPEPSPPKLFQALGALVESATPNLDAEEEEEEEENTTGMRTTEMGVTEIDSLCMNCHETGKTRLLLTAVPYFREIILSSFTCPHCNFRDTEIQSGGEIQPKGQKHVFRVDTVEDLNRQIIKSDRASVRVEELDFEIPPSRGVITTMEGLLRQAYESLEETVTARRDLDPEGAKAVADFNAKLERVLNGSGLPITVVLNDISGNSFIDNPHAPKPDPKLHVSHFVRTLEDNEILGIGKGNNNNNNKGEGSAGEEKFTYRPHKIGSSFEASMKNGGAPPPLPSALKEEVIQIPAACPNCMTEGLADSCVVDLPFFKEVVIMAFNCDECGFKDTEIKGGGSIPERGRRDILRVSEGKVDLNRDVIKGDTAGVKIPELDVELTRGSLGGMYTTVEGLVKRMMDDIFSIRIYQGGDSSDRDRRKRLDDLQEGFERCLSGDMPFTLVVEDPLANSYIYSPYVEKGETDPRLTVETYQRSYEEDEELGLHDMDVDQKPEGNPDEEASKAESVMKSLQIRGEKTHPVQFIAKGMADGER